MHPYLDKVTQDHIIKEVSGVVQVMSPFGMKAIKQMQFNLVNYLRRFSSPSGRGVAAKECVTPAPPSRAPIDPRLVILDQGFGHARSQTERKPVDAAGNPIPWFTYPAIEYLGQLALTDKRVFEYGVGNSTLFWCGVAREVVAVEKTRKWYQYVRANRLENLELFCVEDDSYPGQILRYGEFDIIVIDGSERYACAQNAIQALRPGGLIILDNSDWYVEAARYLRNAGLLQVDLSGFGPINNYTWVTSLFFRRDFDFQPRNPNQPQHVIGGLKKYAAEEDALRRERG